MTEKTKIQNICCDTTNIKEYFFKLYKSLRCGQKQHLHELINSALTPKYDLSTIRSYCVDFDRIPIKKREFFIKLILGCMIEEINFLIDECYAIIEIKKEDQIKLADTLQKYGKEQAS